jgi:hypothetical protein
MSEGCDVARPLVFKLTKECGKLQKCGSFACLIERMVEVCCLPLMTFRQQLRAGKGLTVRVVLRAMKQPFSDRAA